MDPLTICRKTRGSPNQEIFNLGDARLNWGYETRTMESTKSYLNLRFIPIWEAKAQRSIRDPGEVQIDRERIEEKGLLELTPVSYLTLTC